MRKFYTTTLLGFEVVLAEKKKWLGSDFFRLPSVLEGESVQWPISNRPDAALVEDVLSGQVEAFNILLRRWERRIYTYLVHLTREPEESLDLCQEVFVSAYTNLSRLQEPAKFPAWLFRIAHNQAYSYLRRGASQATESAEGNPVEAAPARPAGWQGVEVKLLVEKALASLPVEQREAILLKVYQGFKFSEIAEIQDCPASTIKTRVYTGFQQLKKLLEP